MRVCLIDDGRDHSRLPDTFAVKVEYKQDQNGPVGSGSLWGNMTVYPPIKLYVHIFIKHSSYPKSECLDVPC